MTWLWTPLFVACTGSGPAPFDGPIPERPATFVDPGIGTTGASATHQLWLLPGAYTLPETTLPSGFTPRSRFPLKLEEAGRQRKVAHVYQGPSPFTEDVEGRVGAPPGMKVFVGDEELRYSQSLGGKSWRVNGKRIAVAWPGEAPPQATATYQPAEDLLLRRDFGSAGLDPTEFVKHEVTIDQQTRAGMLLPAPATAEWELELPAGARFRAWTAIAPLPLRSLESDGAYVKLVVIAGDQQIEVAKQFVKQGQDFARWEADLSRWSGQRVKVVLASEPYTTPDFDHVFVGSPTIWGEPSAEVRRVIVIGLDTTRPDHFGFFGYDEETTPELDAVLETSSVFTTAWTPAPRTRPSFRAATTGRDPLSAVGAKNIGEVFQENGFATAGIVANIHLQPRFDFHEGFDHWWFDGQAKADEQVDRALEWLADNVQRDTYLFLHLMDPHLGYRPPSHLAKQFVKQPDPTLPETFNRSEVYQWMQRGELTDLRREHIRALYDAEIRYMSEHLGRLFDQLDRMPGNSLVVLHNDHGEEFWEHGGFEHNHTLYDDVTRAILMFRSGPGQAQGRRIEAPTTLADIGPTLYDFAGFTDLPPIDGRSLGPILLGAEDPSTFAGRPIGVAHLRYGHERWGVVYQGKKYVLHTASGKEELYDLAADPREQKDLSKSTQLDPWRKALSEAHAMPVGRGWRIRANIRTGDRAPFTITLPQPAVEAGIVDPEAATEHPANQAWGEQPRVTKEQVGEVELSEDRTKIVYSPGDKPHDGILYVLFGAEVDPTAVVLERGGKGLATMGSRGTASWREGADQITVEPGTVLVPPPNEAARILALQGKTDEAGADFEELCKLGYVECDEEQDDGHGH